VWEAWSQKNLAIWKLSHGNPPNFTDAERQQYLDGQWAVMHRDTGKEQGKKFADAPVGALFFLCHGNSPQRIGQFTSAAMPCAKGDGWLQRSYRVLKACPSAPIATPPTPSTGRHRAIRPSGRWARTICRNSNPPCSSPFSARIWPKLAALAGEPIEAASIGSGVHRRLHQRTRAKHGQQAGRSLLQPHLLRPARHRQNLHADATAQARLRAAGFFHHHEEWRTQIIAEKVAVLKWWEGAAAAALYDLGGKAKGGGNCGASLHSGHHRRQRLEPQCAANALWRTCRTTPWMSPPR
jgi:5-methylcytosine-specific restriction protein B